MVERLGVTYLEGAAKYIESNYEGIDDGMEVIEWLGQALAPEGAGRLVTSLVAGSTVLVDQAVQAFIHRR